MGAQNTSNQTAFMGDVHDLARLVADALLPELRALAKVDPPMSIRDLAEWTGWGESHIRDLVARKAIPFHNRALPGSERMAVYFWKHEIVAWAGTGEVNL